MSEGGGERERNDKYDLSRMLVEAGAGVNKTTREGRSALLYAASQSDHCKCLMFNCELQVREGRTS